MWLLRQAAFEDDYVNGGRRRLEEFCGRLDGTVVDPRGKRS
jgi:hypothetical protein